MKSRVIVSAVIEKGDLLLFGKKKANVGPYPNSVHLIGGGANLDDELLEDALIREINEEANIKVELVERLGFDEDYEPDKRKELTHYVFLVYRAKYISGEIKPKDDVVELNWYHKKDLNTIPLNKPSIRLFKKMGYLK